MKEIIEYVLAGIIIASFIPLYTMINVGLYNPPPRRIDPNVMVLYSNAVEEVLNELITSNNLTPTLVDLRQLLINRVGLDVYRDYGFHVTLYSWGIANITVLSNKVIVYTRDKGNLTLLVVWSDLSSSTYFTDAPSHYYSEEGVYKYELAVPTSNLIVSVAVLETGILRYINYYIDNSLRELYLLNINGRIYVLNDLSQGSLATSNYAGYPVVETYLYYYTRFNFSLYRRLYFVHSIDTWIYDMCCCSSPTPPTDYLVSLEEKVVPMIYTNVSYYGIYDGTITINGKNYQAFYVSNFKHEENYTEYWERRDIHGGYCSCSEACSSRCPYWVRISQSNPSTYNYLNILASPLYNSVLLLIKDASGRVYYAKFYHYSIDFGDTIPKDWQTDILVYNMRIGMVDYEVTLTIWRRSVV